MIAKSIKEDCETESDLTCRDVRINTGRIKTEDGQAHTQKLSPS